MDNEINNQKINHREKEKKQTGKIIQNGEKN